MDTVEVVMRLMERDCILCQPPFLFVPRKNAMWKFDLTYKLVCCIIFGELQDCDYECE